MHRFRYTISNTILVYDLVVMVVMFGCVKSTFDQCVVKIVRWNVKMIFSITLQYISCNFAFLSFLCNVQFMFLCFFPDIIRCLIQFIYGVDWKWMCVCWYVWNVILWGKGRKNRPRTTKTKHFFRFFFALDQWLFFSVYIIWINWNDGFHIRGEMKWNKIVS